jgi:hypothetical protein
MRSKTRGRRRKNKKTRTKKRKAGGSNKSKTRKKKENFWEPGNYWKKWGFVNLLPTNIRNSMWFYRTAKYGPPPLPKF